MRVGVLMGRSRRGEKMPSESGTVSGARSAGWSCRGAASLGSRRWDGGCGCGRCRGKSGSAVVMVSFLRAGWQGPGGVMGDERGWEVWNVGWLAGLRGAGLGAGMCTRSWSSGFLSKGRRIRTARPLEAATLGTGSSLSERKIQRVLKMELFSLRTWKEIR